MPANRAAIPSFSNAPDTYDRGNEQEFRAQLTRTLTDVTQSRIEKPAIQVEASRSASSATLTVTILDEDRRVTAIEFNKREGSGSATGWVSLWDTTTGTIGTDASLIRSEAISIPAGLDSSAEWRVKWRDQRGAEHVDGGPIPLSNLASVTKTLRLPFTAVAPTDETVRWSYENGYLRPGATGGPGAQFRCVAPLPSGVTTSAIRARVYRETGSDVATLSARVVDDNGGATSAGSVSHSSTGWQTISLSVSQAIGTVALLLTIDLQSVSSTLDSRLTWIEVDYSTPSYDKTY